MEVVKTEVRKPEQLKQLSVGAYYVGSVFVASKPYRPAQPAIAAKNGTKTKPPVQARKAIPEQLAQDAFYFDYYINDNLLFWAKDGNVVFVIHRKSLNWFAPYLDDRRWEVNTNIAQGQQGTMSVTIPEGYDYDTIIEELADFYNK